jgi:hypothetical protein
MGAAIIIDPINRAASIVFMSFPPLFYLTAPQRDPNRTKNIYRIAMSDKALQENQVATLRN